LLKKKKGDSSRAIREKNWGGEEYGGIRSRNFKESKKLY